MKSRWEDIKGIANNIVSNALWELIRNFLIPGIAAGLLAHSQLPAIIVAIVSLLALIGLVLLIYKYKHIDFRYMFLQKTIYFEYRESHSIYKIDHKVKALTNNIDRFYGRYIWDRDKVEMRCVSPDNCNIVPRPLMDAYQKYDVYFGSRKYNMGDIFQVTLESKMIGELRFPLFATTVITPTNLLCIHIKLPLRLLKSPRIRLVVSPTPSEIGVSETADAKLDENGEYIWKIRKPKLAYEYAIEWDFVDEKQAQLDAHNKSASVD